MTTKPANSLPRWRAFNRTPHDIVLAWFRDVLDILRDSGMLLYGVTLEHPVQGADAKLRTLDAWTMNGIHHVAGASCSGTGKETPT